MDDLFQGLLSMGRGQMKTQHVPEEGSDPTLPPFGVVFEEDTSGAGTGGAIPVPPFDSTPVMLAGRTGTSAHALMGAAQIFPNPSHSGNALSMLHQTGEGEVSVPVSSTVAPVMQPNLPTEPGPVPALQITEPSQNAPMRPEQAQTLTQMPTRSTAPDTPPTGLPMGNVTSVGAEPSVVSRGVANPFLNAAHAGNGPSEQSHAAGATADRLVTAHPAAPTIPTSGPQDGATKGDPATPKASPTVTQGTPTERANALNSFNTGATQPGQNMALDPQATSVKSFPRPTDGSAPTLLKTDASPATVSDAERPLIEPTKALAPNTSAPAPTAPLTVPLPTQKAAQMSIQSPLTSAEDEAPPLVDGTAEGPDRADRLTIAPPPQRTDRPASTPAIGPAVAFAAQTAAGSSTTTTAPSAPADFETGIELFGTLQSATHAPAATLSPSVAAPFHAPPNAPTLVAQQIAAALQDRATDPGQPLELALDPPELGRVRMHMAELAGVLTLTIHAERPETAELMRRHLDLLAQEFSDAGVDAPSVRISQDGAGAQSGEHGQSERADTPRDGPTDAPTPVPHARTANGSGALDLRL